jgi:uncharacterized membrane protein YbhN (UPF0104 family)
MPGAVSGDIIKAVYIIRDQKESGKTRTMLTILLDRVIGLAGLFVMAGMALLFTTKEVWDNPSLAKIAIFIAIAILGLVAGVALIFFPFKEGRDPFIKIFSIKLPGVSILRQIYEAMRSLSAQPKILCYTLAISILIHCCALLFAYYITEVLLHETVALPTFAVIFPVGLITTAIPLAPGGLGIGHVAFDRLYHLVGLHGGANVFNVMVLGQLSLHLLGVIPYLMYRRTDLKEPTT